LNEPQGIADAEYLDEPLNKPKSSEETKNQKAKPDDEIRSASG
jgi:hypothetical protein